MNIHIQKLNPAARLPEYAHVGDAGMDVFALIDVTIAPGQRVPVPTGIAMQIPDEYVALVWDKSGRALKDGLTTLAGVIDSGYRGEVQVVLLNISDTPIDIAAGEKIAQILIQPIISATLTEVSALANTDRGDGGFGSTGV